MSWPRAARDHDTFCVSCHTALPYALSRSALRSALSESGPTSSERKLLDNVAKRVQIWQDVKPFYPDGGGLPRSQQSRTTEAILNALILASYDAPSAALSDPASRALDNMWPLQLKSGADAGAFPWLNFHNEPWEAEDSPYFGVALAAIAAGVTPPSYQAAPAIRSNIRLLETYLQREFPNQTEINRAFALWASAKLPDLFTPEQKKSAADAIFHKQREDGGWSLSTVIGNWKRRDNTPLEARSDGYATALLVLALEKAGVPREDARLKKGLDWLRTNQTKDGFWQSYSPNLNRDLSSDAGRFMSDAATAYAVLALTGR